MKQARRRCASKHLRPQEVIPPLSSSCAWIYSNLFFFFAARDFVCGLGLFLFVAQEQKPLYIYCSRYLCRIRGRPFVLAQTLHTYTFTPFFFLLPPRIGFTLARRAKGKDSPHRRPYIKFLKLSSMYTARLLHNLILHFFKY